MKFCNDQYLKLRALQRQSYTHYFYEATVGAGLPIISTLRGLLETGDKILKIEGIFRLPTHLEILLSAPPTPNTAPLSPRLLGLKAIIVGYHIKRTDSANDESKFCICYCSGTLSYIFNNFSGKTPFSEVVARAKEAGYTEPDPRDDLSGTDVARKVSIYLSLKLYSCLIIACKSFWIVNNLLSNHLTLLFSTESCFIRSF